MYKAAIAAAVLVVSCLSTIPLAASAQEEAAGDPTAEKLFDQRIMPIFRSDQPSSCVQCHLAGVDLKDYILPSMEDTFVSLRDQGLIDLDDPGQSKILTLIQMGERDLDEGARLIHEQMRQAEYEAFAGWIEACCNDPSIRELPSLESADYAGPERPNEVIRHARRSRVVDSFARNVWSQRMRCFPCHTPHEIDESNPRHAAAIKKREEFAELYDEELLARLDIFRETPEETLQYLIDASRNTSEGDLPLLNLSDPTQSLLVRKPLSKLPPQNPDGTFPLPKSREPLFHLGGLKMHPDDQSYKSFIAWIQDYASVVHDEYTSVEDLPADNWHASQLVIRWMSVPDELPVGMPVQLFIHARDEEGGGWLEAPAAFTQGTVTPNRVVNGALFLLAPEGQDAEPVGEQLTLPRGDYLVKAFVDFDGRLQEDPTLLLGDGDYFGEAELRRARWREGFRSAQTVTGLQPATE